MKRSELFDKVYGCLVAGLIGDAMGAPVEGMDYDEIERRYVGGVADFEGEGTDDSAIKLILCEAILQNGGHITADEFGAALLRAEDKYELYYIPVRNTFMKLGSGCVLPIYAGAGNMPSSSTAMAISPMGLINAGDPRRAALETFDVTGVIHGAEATFCRDAACAMAAAVAAAMVPDATVASVLAAATAYLHPQSSAEMVGYIREALRMAAEAGTYAAFRAAYTKANCKFIHCDSRETVSCALALFMLAKGDPNLCVLYGANYGRDADTIATMAGALGGAFSGAKMIRPEWLHKVSENNKGQEALANRLIDVWQSRMQAAQALMAAFGTCWQEPGEGNGK